MRANRRFLIVKIIKYFSQYQCFSLLFNTWDFVIILNMSKFKKILYNRIPILEWLPKYRRSYIIEDFVTGLTIGLKLLPQSMAFAGLANVPPQYGLYSSFMGIFLYIALGKIKEVTIGPTNLMSLLSGAFTNDLPVEFMIVLTFVSGCVELMLGVLRLGFLVDFISIPTISGFQSATAVVVIVSQLKGLLGLDFRAIGFVNNLRQVVNHLPEIRHGDAVLGISSLIGLAVFHKLKDFHIHSGNGKFDKIINKTFWMLSISKNATIVLFCSLIAYYCEVNGFYKFTVTGDVPSGLPSFTPPAFSTEFKNETYTFFDMVGELGPGVIVCPMISILVDVAIGKSFAEGKPVDATQEMLSLGICNILGSFVQSIPTCGAFTRGAMSHASGVRTPLSGIYTGVLILLALTYLTPYFYYIPKATLSAVLIIAICCMFDYKILKPLWKTNKFDFINAVSTFFVSLYFGVEYGLLYGIFLNAANLLRYWVRPHIKSQKITLKTGQEFVLISLSLGMVYATIDYFLNKINKIGIKNRDLPVILDCKYILASDFTAAKGIERLSKDFKLRDQKLILVNLSQNIKCSLNEVIDMENFLILKPEMNVQNNIDEENYFIDNASFSFISSLDVNQTIIVDLNKKCAKYSNDRLYDILT